MDIKTGWKKEVKNILLLTAAALIMSLNLNSFINAGGTYPGGAAGLTLLIMRIAEKFMNIALPYSAVYLPMNLALAYIGFKDIGKRFTLASLYVIILTSFLTDMLPEFAVTYDMLLIGVFGGIINGFAVGLCLMAGGSTGGTDFISIYFSEKRGIDTWNYIFAGNVVILLTAGVLFGLDKALYSIILQFCSTQVIQMVYQRYQKDTLFIITAHPEDVYQTIRRITHHDATLIDGIGGYEKAQRHILYSVIGREEVDHVINEIRLIDPGAFINVINTEQINGRFYKRPTQ